MASNAEVIFKINADTSKAKQNLDGLDNTGKKVDSTFSKSALFSGAIGGIAATATNKVMGLFSDLTGRVMRSSDAAIKFEQTLKFAGLKDDKIKKITESVKEFSRASIFAIDDLLNTTALLAANGVPDADNMTKALGGLTAAAGGNRESFNSVALAYTSVTAQGKLMAEDWNILIGAIPGASKILQDALKKNGAYVGNFKDAMANGEIKTKDVKKAVEDVGLTDLAQEAATSTKTFEGIFASINSSVATFGKKLLAAIGEDNIKNALRDFQQGLKAVLDGLIEVANWASKNKELIKNLAIGAGAFAAAFKFAIVIKGFMDVSKSINKSIQSIKFAIVFAKEAGVLFEVMKVGLISSFKSIGTAIAGIAASNPLGWIGILIAAVVAAVVLIILNWDTVKKVVLDVGKSIGDFFSGLGKWAGDAVNDIVKFFNDMGSDISNTFNDIVSTIGDILSGIVNFFSDMGSAIANVVIGIVDFILVPFKLLFKGIMIVLSPLIEFWKGMFNIWLTVVQGFINIVVGLFNILVALVQIALIPFQILFQVIIDVIVALFRGLVTIVVEIFNFLVSLIQIALTPLVALFQLIIATIVALFNGLISIVVGIFNLLVEGIKVVVTPIIEVFKFIGSSIASVFKGIVNVIKSMINFMVSAFKKMAKTVSGIFNGIANTIKGVFSGVVSFIKGIINGIIDGINVVISGINLIPKHTKVPKIPKLAKGGVVNRPTHALIGEAGPEAVVPLTPKGISSFMQGISRYNTGDYNNGKTTNITMNVTNNGNFDGKSVERYLTKLAKQGGM